MYYYYLMFSDLKSKLNSYQTAFRNGAQLIGGEFS